MSIEETVGILNSYKHRSLNTWRLNNGWVTVEDNSIDYRLELSLSEAVAIAKYYRAKDAESLCVDASFIG